MRVLLMLLLVVATLVASSVHGAVSGQAEPKLLTTQATDERALKDTAANIDTDSEERGVKDAANYVASLFSKNKRIQRMFAKGKSSEEVFSKGAHPIDVWFALKIPKLQATHTLSELAKNPKYIFWAKYEAFWKARTATKV